VTGSRSWDRPDVVEAALAVALYGHGGMVVVHGSCPTGADAIASEWARRYAHLGVVEERHHAAWNLYGRAAGPKRNQQMVNAGADLCLAFPVGRSSGTRSCIRLARAAGIPVRVWEAER
jgi:hypothetical protein